MSSLPTAKETLYSIQVEIREMQRGKLNELKKDDLEDLRSIESRVGSDQFVMQTIHNIIDRRYTQLNRIFDENIQEIQCVIQEEQRVHIDIEKMFSEMNCEAQSEGSVKISEINVSSDENSKLEIDEVDNSFIEKLRRLNFNESDSLMIGNHSGELESILIEEQCSQDEAVIESIISSIELIILEELIEECLCDDFYRVEEISISGLSDAFTLPPAINNSPSEVIHYIDQVISILLTRKSELELMLLTPRLRDPLEMLCDIQEYEIGTPNYKKYEYDGIVPVDIYLILEREREQQVKSDIPMEDRSVLNIEHIHNKMVFDSINELLQHCRVYGFTGAPFPWSDLTRSVCGAVSVEEVLRGLRERMIECCNMCVGKIMSSEIFSPTGEMNEEIVNNIRAEKLSNMLALELIDNDQVWADYEFEEDQVKIDISDVIFEVIVIETIKILPERLNK